MRWLTSAEAADYLRLKERKLYELLAEGAVPANKVSGKWLFEAGALDLWLRSGALQPPGISPREPPPILGGTHDPLLEWALRESGAALASLSEGSEAGFVRLLRREVLVAAVHFHAEDPSVDANIEALRTRPELHDAVLIGFARREQGLVVAPGNPLGLVDVPGALAKRARVALRQPGAGARQLFEALLKRSGLALRDAQVPGPICLTGEELARAIHAGEADCGIASRSVAHAMGLGFVPLLWERIDLVMRQRDYFGERMQALLRFLPGEAMAARAQTLGGYALDETGHVRMVR